MGSTILLPHRHDFLKVATTGIVSNSSKHLLFFFFLNGHKGVVLRILHLSVYWEAPPFASPSPIMALTPLHLHEMSVNQLPPRASRAGTRKTGLPGLDSVTTGFVMFAFKEKKIT